MQNDFIKSLESLRGRAAIQNGTLSVPDILAAFPAVELSDEQIALIYDYLERENITLEDYEPHDVNTLEIGGESGGGEDTEREQRLLEIYQEELSSIAPLSNKEEEGLILDLLSGARARREPAARRLTEGNLRWVIRLAREEAGRGVSLPDLIQEGNLALWESIQAYAGEESLSDRLEKDIKKAMKTLIRESGSAVKTEDEMTLLANRVFETVQEMEEELDRPVTPAEISGRTGIPQSRVETVLRESAKAIQNREH